MVTEREEMIIRREVEQMLYRLEQRLGLRPLYPGEEHYPWNVMAVVDDIVSQIDVEDD